MPEAKAISRPLKIVSYASQNPDRQRDLAAGVAEILAGRPYELLFPSDKPAAFGAMAEAEILLTIKEAEILLTWKLSPEMFRVARRLRWVHLGNAGVDNSLFPELIASDIVLTNASGIHGAYIAEWTLAALLYLSQRFGEAEAWRRDRQWRPHKDPMTRTRFLIEGLRALIVGYGAVGQAVTRRLSAAGVRCEGLVVSAREAEIPLHTPDQLPAILGGFDVVVMALPLTEKTRGFLSRDLIRQMKPGALFVNVGRGQTVDEAALIEALRHGPLGGAALDVFAIEPLPGDSPLFDLPNVFMTPHVSGNFPQYTHRVNEGFLRNLAHYVAGEPLENVVDKRRGY